MSFPVNIDVGYVLECINKQDDDKLIYMIVSSSKTNDLVAVNNDHWFPLSRLDNDELNYAGIKINKIYGKGSNKYSWLPITESRSLLWDRELQNESSKDFTDVLAKIKDAETISELKEVAKDFLTEIGASEKDANDFLTGLITLAIADSLFTKFN